MTAGNRHQFAIERMTETDLTEIVELERACGLSSRGIEAYAAIMKLPHYILLVARQLDLSDQPSIGIAGFFSAVVVLDELHIDNVAVNSDFRRRGAASALLHKGMLAGCLLGAEKSFLEVRESNLAAIGLYLKHGFSQAGLRKDYYSHPTENAIIMTADSSLSLIND